MNNSSKILLVSNREIVGIGKLGRPGDSWTTQFQPKNRGSGRDLVFLVTTALSLLLRPSGAAAQVARCQEKMNELSL